MKRDRALDAGDIDEIVIHNAPTSEPSRTAPPRHLDHLIEVSLTTRATNQPLARNRGLG